MKKKRLKQFASVVLTLTLAVQPVIAGAQELDVPAENFDSAEVFADAKEEERTARFVSAIAAVLPDGSELVTEGTVEGLIAHEPAGNGGFGYDPIFYLPEYGVTSAEIPIEKKNEISHRGKALEAMKIKLRERL